jgi:hypothetical protein
MERWSSPQILTRTGEARVLRSQRENRSANKHNTAKTFSKAVPVTATARYLTVILLTQFCNNIDVHIAYRDDSFGK